MLVVFHHLDHILSFAISLLSFEWIALSSRLVVLILFSSFEIVVVVPVAA